MNAISSGVQLPTSDGLLFLVSFYHLIGRLGEGMWLMGLHVCLH